MQLEATFADPPIWPSWHLGSDPGTMAWLTAASSAPEFLRDMPSAFPAANNPMERAASAGPPEAAASGDNYLR